MNEIVPRTPDRGSEYDDENWYVPETPQSAASPQTCNGVPIPSLTRIRRSLGVLDSSPPAPERTPSLKQCCERTFSDGKRNASRFENCSQDSLRFFKRARVSLFRDKRGEEGSEQQHVQRAFSVNTKAFYGSTGSDEVKPAVLAGESFYGAGAGVEEKPAVLAAGESFYGVSGGVEEKPAALANKPLYAASGGVEEKPIIPVKSFYGSSGVKEEKPIVAAKAFYGSIDAKEEKPFIDVKPAIKQTAKRKQVSPLFLNASKQRSMKRIRAGGEINRGVGHGIKRPKTSKKSPSNSTKSEKKKSSPKSEANKRLEEADDEYEKVQIYDPTKKFFKCKYVTRLKAKVINALENIENNSNSANDELNASDAGDCEAIARSPDVKTRKRAILCNNKELANQRDLNKKDECSNTYPLVDLGTSMKSHGKHILNMSVNKFNLLDKILEHENKFRHCSSTCNASASGLSLLENNNVGIVEPEKNAQARRNKADKAEEVENQNQYLINFKEDHFNTVECKECQQYNLIYKFNGENNKDVHTKYHDSFQYLKYQEWKNQRLVFEDLETRIKVILIKSDDYMLHKTKLTEILNLVAEEINVDGCGNFINNKSNKVYFLMKHNIIISILVAGITIIQDHILSKPKIMFGVGFIWTAKSFRRQKIASQLIDVMRSNFDDDYRIELNQIAFSKKFLTLDGKAFAASYTKSSALKVY